MTDEVQTETTATEGLPATGINNQAREVRALQRVNRLGERAAGLPVAQQDEILKVLVGITQVKNFIPQK